MRTLITAILCVLASSTFASTSGASELRRSEVKTVQQRRHKEQPVRHHQVMNERDFQFLYKTIKKKSFDKDRLEILRVGVLDNYFTCRQCARLMSLYKFDDDKLKILRIMAGHLVDMNNHNDILKQFDFDSNRRKALDILGFKHERNRGRF
jgi:hypothetical protein